MSSSLLWLSAFWLTISLAYGCGPVLTSTKSSVVTSPQESGRIGYYLPKAILHLQCKPKDTKYELSCVPEIVPDQNQFYLLKYHPSSAADDIVNIGLQKDGLLTSVSTTTSDKWVEIVQKLAQIPKEVVKAMAVPGKVLKPGTELEVVVDVHIDPDIFLYDDANSLTERKKLLKSLEYDYGIKLTLKPLLTRSAAYNQGKIEPSAQDGIYYRLPIPYTLEVTMDVITEAAAAKGGGSSVSTPGVKVTKSPPGTKPGPKPKAATGQPAKATAKSESPTAKQPTEEEQDQQSKKLHKTKYCLNRILYLPNGGPILSLDVLRAALVEKKNEITLENGMLTSAKQTKPSEILAGLNIPLEIIKALVSLPTDLIQLKINYSKADQAYLTQQLNEIVAREALMKKLEEISQKKQGGLIQLQP
jgi:hypothetical protein